MEDPTAAPGCARGRVRREHLRGGVGEGYRKKKGGGVQVGGRERRGWSVAAQQQRRGLTYRDPPPPPLAPPPPTPSLFLPGEPDDYQLLGGDVPLVVMAIECQSRAGEGSREGRGEGERGGVVEFTHTAHAECVGGSPSERHVFGDDPR